MLFFSHFTLSCVSNDFWGDYYELEPQAQRSIALIAQHHVKRPFPLQITNYTQNLYSRLRDFQANCSVIQREICDKRDDFTVEN